MEVLAGEAGVDKVELTEGRIKVTMVRDEQNYDHLATELVQKGFRLLEFREEVPSLEAAFMTFTQGIQS